MRNSFRRRLVAALIPAASAAALACSVQAAELPLSRVVLSSAGLAQFTHAGTVAGGTAVDLPVRLDQVDDVLKSLTVLDRPGGIGAVTLPGKTPLAELFKDLPFGPDALNSPTRLLNSLVGSEVEIAGPVTARGRVFRVENETVALPNNGGTTTRHRLTLMTDKGMVQAVLEELTSLRFTDPQANAQIERALAGVTENRAKDRRRVSIGFLGEGSRKVAISYVVAAPLWKTAYRLVLPKEGGKARLQGWAVIENLTGGDWKDVDLVLVSGNPVALHQRLYDAIFAERPDVPIAGATQVVPRPDDADKERSGARKKAMAPAPAPMMVQRAAPGRAMGGLAFEAPPALGSAAAAADAEEASTQLLYRFPAKISLPTGHTMMVPFVDREIAATHTWLYQAETSAHHPLAAVRLRNDGDAGLPAGIVTAYETAGDGSMNFVGDAQLPVLAKGASRFATFALDARTDVRREDKGVTRTTLGQAANGTLTLTTRLRRTIAYQVTAPPEEDREIVVEEPRADGWSPSPGSGQVEQTATLFRLTIAAPKGKTTSGTLSLDRAESRSVVLTSLGAEEIFATIRGLQNESPALKDSVARLGSIVGEIAKARAERGRLDAERKKIAADQDRIRQNLQSAGAGSDLGRRYLDTLKAQEDRLAEINRQDQKLETDIAAQRKTAEDVARQLTL